MTIHEEMLAITRSISESLTFADHGCEFDHHAEIARRPVDEIIDDLRSGKIATMCAGAAVLARAKARQSGIEAIALNFGQIGTRNSHVIVAAKHENGSYSLYCPTFSLALLDSMNGGPAAIDLICGCIADRDFKRLRFVRLTGQPLRMLSRDTAEHGPFLIDKKEIGGGKLLCTLDRTRYAIWLTRRMMPWLRLLYTDASAFDFFRFPVSHSGEVESERICEKLRRIGHPAQ